MRVLLYFFMVLLTLGCQKDRLLQVEANIAYLDAKFENNIESLETSLGALQRDVNGFISDSEDLTLQLESYASSRAEGLTQQTQYQNEIQNGHLNRFDSDLEAVNSIVYQLEATNRELTTHLENLEVLKTQLEAGASDQHDLLIEEIYALEAAIAFTYSELEKALYDDFLSLSEEAFTAISELVSDVEGSQETLEVIIQQIIEEQQDYVTLAPVSIDKVQGLIEIPESVYSLAYPVVLNPEAVTASSTTLQVTQLTLSGIKGNLCKDLELTYSDNTNEILLDVICDIDVVSSTTVTKTWNKDNTTPPTPNGGAEEEEEEEEESSAKKTNIDTDPNFSIAFKITDLDNNQCNTVLYRPIFTGYQNVIFDVFDSNGDLVYQEHSSATGRGSDCLDLDFIDSGEMFGWDGLFQGVQLDFPGETFSWTLVALHLDGVTQDRHSGSFTIGVDRESIELIIN